MDIDDPVCQLDDEFGEAVCEGDTNKKIQALEVLHQKYDMFHNFAVFLECRGDKTGIRI